MEGAAASVDNTKKLLEAIRAGDKAGLEALLKRSRDYCGSRAEWIVGPAVDGVLRASGAGGSFFATWGEA